MAKGQQLEINDFPGLINNSDPRDIPDGASTAQMNLTCRVHGELRTRRGYRYALFDSIVIVPSLAAD